MTSLRPTDLVSPADAPARRHARAMLWTVAVFCAGQLALLTWRLFQDAPKWNALAMILLLPVSGLIPLVRGPRYVGVLLFLDAGLVFAQAFLASREQWPLFSATHAVFVASMFAKGLWPLFERDVPLSRGDTLGPWGAALGIYVGLALGILRSDFDDELIVGGCVPLGIVLMIQSCQRALTILRGPREARPPRVGLPVRPVADGSPVSMKPAADE